MNDLEVIKELEIHWTYPLKLRVRDCYNTFRFCATLQRDDSAFWTFQNGCENVEQTLLPSTEDQVTPRKLAFKAKGVNKQHLAFLNFFNDLYFEFPSP